MPTDTGKIVDIYLQPMLLSHSKFWLEPQQYHMPAMETEAERQPFLGGDHPVSVPGFHPAQQPPISKGSGFKGLLRPPDLLMWLAARVWVPPECGV